jgi:hypothetical protein
MYEEIKSWSFRRAILIISNSSAKFRAFIWIVNKSIYRQLGGMSGSGVIYGYGGSGIRKENVIIPAGNAFNN